MVLRLLSALACLAVATGQWTTMTYYDVLQEDCRGDIANKDLGDPAGDAYCKKGYSERKREEGREQRHRQRGRDTETEQRADRRTRVCPFSNVDLT